MELAIVAGEWIKMRHDLRDDPACLTLSDMLSDTLPETFGRLFLFWSFADRHTSNGQLTSVTKLHIDRVAEKTGFADALIQVGWLAENDGCLEMPSFARHNGNSSKARSLESEAKSLRRNDKKQAETAIGKQRPTLSDKTSDQRREEKSKKSKPKSGKAASTFDPSKVDFPEKLNHPTFHQAWASWIKHRNEKRKPLTETSVTMQFNEFESWGIARAVAAINHTITKGWVGIRESDTTEVRPAGVFTSPKGPKPRKVAS